MIAAQANPDGGVERESSPQPQLKALSQLEFAVCPEILRTVPATVQIKELVDDVPGWSSLDQLSSLYQLAHETSHLRGDIVEVGTWCGRSALVLGLSVRATGRGRVHCIDYFPEKTDWTRNPDGSYSFTVIIDGQIYAGHQAQTVWQQPFEKDIAPVYQANPSLLLQFRENVIRHQMGEVIRPLRGNSEIFARTVEKPFECRLAFIDGGHDYDSVCADIDNLEPFLVPGGWICFDDAFSSYRGVDRAIEDRILSNPDYEFGQQLTRKFFVARRKS